ncbi:MAG: UDP-2,3-diacylglucosamine diphosphatase [Gammaproteobacteria bacterium]|nr:UDP-2,3-diacylglucosamine diphosphatase [Gammaproteobacteria bacterium]MCP5135807.1 UDP-2,3-diacylglucosamine diphosphatase [Gammaproteobacteria bacterium]
MPETLFIADVHLDERWPEISDGFLQLLATRARTADALYILGDLFEVWIGDDDPDPYYAQVQDAIRRLSDAGVTVFVQHGNRDFLLGNAFAKRTGATLLADRTVVDLYGTSVLLMHGDQLCTDDDEYQRFRLMARDPVWQAEVLAKSVDERRQIARYARSMSTESQRERAEDIGDVNMDAVASAMREAEVRHLIHGHTHRPGIHHDALGERIVIPDWRPEGSGLVRWTPDSHGIETWP